MVDRLQRWPEPFRVLTLLHKAQLEEADAIKNENLKVFLLWLEKGDDAVRIIEFKFLNSVQIGVQVFRWNLLALLVLN